MYVRRSNLLVLSLNGGTFSLETFPLYCSRTIRVPHIFPKSLWGSPLHRQFHSLWLLQHVSREAEIGHLCHVVVWYQHISGCQIPACAEAKTTFSCYRCFDSYCILSLSLSQPPLPMYKVLWLQIHHSVADVFGKVKFVLLRDDRPAPRPQVVHQRTLGHELCHQVHWVVVQWDANERYQIFMT